jgi:GH18 family chitinase
MVSYDNAQSFGTSDCLVLQHITDDYVSAAKGKFINDKTLKGYSMWHSAGDSNDILVDSINSAMGIAQC